MMVNVVEKDISIQKVVLRKRIIKMVGRKGKRSRDGELKQEPFKEMDSLGDFVTRNLVVEKVDQPVRDQNSPDDRRVDLDQGQEDMVVKDIAVDKEVQMVL